MKLFLVLFCFCFSFFILQRQFIIFSFWSVSLGLVTLTQWGAGVTQGSVSCSRISFVFVLVCVLVFVCLFVFVFVLVSSTIPLCYNPSEILSVWCVHHCPYSWCIFNDNSCLPNTDGCEIILLLRDFLLALTSFSSRYRNSENVRRVEFISSSSFPPGILAQRAFNY